MNWIWLSCVINIGNMAHLGGSLSEHWLPSTACRIMRCSSHLEATFVLSLFPMNFCLLAFRVERIHIPTLAGPKNAAQQAYKRRESMMFNLYCTVSIHMIGENNGHVPQLSPIQLSSAPSHSTEGTCS